MEPHYMARGSKETPVEELGGNCTRGSLSVPDVNSGEGYNPRRVDFLRIHFCLTTRQGIKKKLDFLASG